jgi:hypothetical protein
VAGAGLAPHLDPASLAGLVIGAKGFTSPGLSTWVLPGRATSRRGLGVVWPEKDPSTRARAIKAVVRARAAKTGERYTTARRHVLRELNSPASPASPASPPSTKGGLSDKKSIEKTGHDLAHWFAILDRFGAIAKGHTASTELLYKQHNVPGWYRVNSGPLTLTPAS